MGFPRRDSFCPHLLDGTLAFPLTGAPIPEYLYATVLLLEESSGCLVALQMPRK